MPRRDAPTSHTGEHLPASSSPVRLADGRQQQRAILNGRRIWGVSDSMATSDGIENFDWEHVKELAIEVLSASERPEETDVSRTELLAYLDTLELKYGPLPSILATRADFIDDYETKELLLKLAYDAAASIGDVENLSHIAHSLAELYIDTLVNVAEARKWLDRLDAHLLQFHDSTYLGDAKRFREQLNQLDFTSRT